MGKFKFYAIIDNKDGTGAIVESWEECERRVKNVSNISYKGFSTYEDAVSWINGKPRNGVFVDGATDGNGKVVWAVVLIVNHAVQDINCGTVPQESNMVELGSVGGELYALLMSLPIAQKYNLPIYVDYEGTTNFISGEYTAQKEGTREFMRRYKENITFLKFEPRIEYIKAHSGIIGNEIADNSVKLMLKR